MLTAFAMKSAVTTSPGFFRPACLIFWPPLLCAEMANASGQLPPVVFLERTLPDIDACGNLLNKVFREDQTIRTDLSDDRRHYVCEGGHFTGTSTQGFTLEEYEDRPNENHKGKTNTGSR